MKCCCIKPDSQYDASTVSITSVMNILYLRKNLNFSWSNVFFDVQKCDNLIGWTLEMLHTHHWSRNQFIPPSPWCSQQRHWCQRHIVKLCEPGLRQLTSQSHICHTLVHQHALGQLIQYYHRFHKVLSQHPFKTLPIRSELINIHHLMVEVKKYRQVF